MQTVAGIVYPTPKIYYSTAGLPPFIEANDIPIDTNEPYETCKSFVYRALYTI